MLNKKIYLTTDVSDDMLPYVVTIYDKFSRSLCSMCNNRLSMKYLCSTIEYYSVCSNCGKFGNLDTYNLFDNVIAKSLRLHREEMTIFLNDVAPEYSPAYFPVYENNAKYPKIKYPNWGKPNVRLKKIKDSFSVLMRLKKELENSYGEHVSSNDRERGFEKFTTEQFPERSDHIMQLYTGWKKLRVQKYKKKKRKHRLINICKRRIEKYKNLDSCFYIDVDTLLKLSESTAYIYSFSDYNVNLREVKKRISGELWYLYNKHKEDIELKQKLNDFLKLKFKRRPSIVYYNITRSDAYPVALTDYMEKKTTDEEILNNLYCKYKSGIV